MLHNREIKPQIDSFASTDNDYKNNLEHADFEDSAIKGAEKFMNCLGHFHGAPFLIHNFTARSDENGDNICRTNKNYPITILGSC
jgi:hypothetical protein